MSYVPKLPKENVNVSKRHPLLDLATLLGGALAILLGLYFLLGLAVDLTVDHLPADFEADHLAELRFPMETDPDDPFLDPTEDVLERLLDHADDMGYDFELAVAPGNDINAFALPGGGIVIMRALLSQAESENEVAMVLAHELGHFAHRDHLRGLGRGLVIASLSALMFGDDTIGRVLGSTLNLAQLSYSRGQETAADIYGLQLLNKAYGHVGGSTAFFERLLEKDIPGLAWATSHPLSRKRISTIQAHIGQRGYAQQATLPWPPLE